MKTPNTPTPPPSFQKFAERHPDVVEAYGRLGEAVRAAGPLSEREIALVKLAVSVGARMEGAVHAHTRKALAAGIAADALAHVALLACPTVGFPNMMAAHGWILEEAEKANR